MKEEPGQYHHRRLVGGVEELRDLEGERVRNHGDRLGDVAVALDVRRYDGVGRLERRVARPDIAQLVVNLEEPAEVGIPPVAPGPLSLDDYRLDRLGRRFQVVHRDELRPTERLLGRLGLSRAGEKALLSVLVGEVD